MGLLDSLHAPMGHLVSIWAYNLAYLPYIVNSDIGRVFSMKYQNYVGFNMVAN